MRDPLRFSIASRIRNRYIKEMLNPKRGERILDVGCGIGYFSELLSNSGAMVFGVDIDHRAIEAAKEFNPAVNFSVCSAENIPLKTETFDKIICTEVLEHIKDDGKVIKEMRRLTKPGGLILLTVPCSEGIFGSLIKNIGHTQEDTFEKHYRKGYSLKDIRELGRRNELELSDYAYSMVLFSELYMGLTKLIFLLLKKHPFKQQSDLRSINENSLAMRLNKIFLLLFLKLAALEDRLLSGLIKGHMLLTLFIRRH